MSCFFYCITIIPYLSDKKPLSYLLHLTLAHFHCQCFKKMPCKLDIDLSLGTMLYGYIVITEEEKFCLCCDSLVV